MTPRTSPPICKDWLSRTRSSSRRAERLVSELARTDPVNPEALKYLNRLSDHLFVPGQRLNDNGTRDVLWRPRANRGPCALRVLPGRVCLASGLRQR
jgi:hypothetical protein